MKDDLPIQYARDEADVGLTISEWLCIAIAVGSVFAAGFFVGAWL